MPFRSIRGRLTLWYVSLLSVTFLCLGAAAYGLLSFTVATDVDAALTGVARALADQARRAGPTGFPPNLDDLFRRFFGVSPLDRYFELLDPSGQHDPRRPGTPFPKPPLSQLALENARKGLPTYETVEGLGPNPVRLLTFPVVEAARVVNLVQVGMSLESLLETKRRFLLILGATLPIALLLAGGGGWLLARRALKPVDRMTESARRISAEHLAQRLPVTGSGDELDRLAETLNGMLGRLDEAFAQIRQFSADASHELQTPLTILKGELEVALRASRSPEEYERTLRSGLEEIDRMGRLVEGLLLLARADAGVLRMDDQPVDLGQLLEEVHGQARPLAEARGLALEIGSLEPLAVRGDPERIRRLLLNLAENGIKYTPPGGRVTLSLERREEWAALRVADTGIGLSPEEMEKVFQRFFRAADARSMDEGGAGLGLCIARSIAEAHGGKIEVQSRAGGGSVFTVLLPLHA